MTREKLVDIGLLLLRLALAMVMFYHGAQKVFGIFGGRGVEATVAGWGERHQFPLWLSYLGMYTEFLSSIALSLGLLTRFAALGMSITMAVAAWTHIKGGDEWNKIEFPLMLGICALALLCTGAGRLSLDYLFFGRKRGKKG